MRITMSTLVLVLTLAVGCKKSEEKQQPHTAKAVPPDAPTGLVSAAELATFAPLLEHLRGDAQHSQALIDLGRQLYYDARLSKSQTIACNSCHPLDAFGVDGKPTSPGHNGQLGSRNSPTVYNAAGHATQFWDGRAANVEEQAKGPVLNPVEMAMADEAAVVRVLKSIPGYAPAFAAAFPDEPDAITFDNMAIAIGAFERGLVTPGSKWDAYLRGDRTALSEAQERGLRTFIDTGCVSCHSGTFLGGGMLQKVGAVEPWPNQSDLGRFNVTNAEADKMMFKVPSLRNVAMTGPYFHDGSVAELPAAVKLMAKHQLGRALSDADAAAIASFLATLTGEPPASYIAKPELPMK